MTSIIPICFELSKNADMRVCTWNNSIYIHPLLFKFQIMSIQISYFRTEIIFGSFSPRILNKNTGKVIKILIERKLDFKVNAILKLFVVGTSWVT